MTGLRADLLDRLGIVSYEDDPAPEIVEETRTGGRLRRTVRYDVAADERVGAYLLLPEGHRSDPPHPGVLAVHQHAAEYALGKSEPAGLTEGARFPYGAELCDRGYVVLCPDLLGFEDRRPAGGSQRDGWSPDGEAYERLLATEYLMRGGSLQGKHVGDLATALDVLTSQDRVDPDRIGVIGHSLGGLESLWLSWYDQRISVGVSSCGVGTYETISRERIPHHLPIVVPGLLEVGDFDVVIRDLAPTPFMTISGTDDRIFPIDGVNRVNEAAAAAYEAAGSPDRFEAVTFTGDHEFPGDMRRRAYEWLDTWLAH